MKSCLPSLPACLLISSGLFFAGCQERQQPVVQKAYFLNGHLKVEQTVVHGRLHGRYRTFYPNGKMESQYSYVNGKLNGPVYLYYTSGALKGRLRMSNDALNGATQLYYRDGGKKETGFYAQGKSTGTFILFDSVTGKPVEQHRYTKEGRLYYADGYDSQGHPFHKGLIPLIDATTTVTRGGRFTGRMCFGLPLPGEITLIIGRGLQPKNNWAAYRITDTLSVVRPDAQGVFSFSFSPHPASIGQHSMHYEFRHKSAPHDSLSVDGLSGTEHFWVVEPKKSAN